MMGTAILPAQDCLASYKENQNRHSTGRAYLLQSGHQAVHTNKSLRGKTSDFEKTKSDPQTVPGLREFERRRWSSQRGLAFAASEAVSTGKLSNGTWNAQNFRSAERILRPMCAPAELHANGSAPFGESLSVFYAQQSYLQQSVSSRHYFQDAKYQTANHEVKGRKFSQQSKHIVMEKVTILKRGETMKAKELDKKIQIREKLPLVVNNVESRPLNTKKNKSVWASKIATNGHGDGTKTIEAAKPANPNIMDDNLVITSTERLGPDPSVLPKEGSGILQSITAGMKATESTIGNGSPVILKESDSFDGVDYCPVESPLSSSDYVNSSSPVFKMEKWAGPAYSNSPPPSSLPLPKFSKPQMRSIATDLIDASVCPKNIAPAVNVAEMSHTQKRVQSTDGSSIQFGFDVGATQDLRRLLGLD